MIYKRLTYLLPLLCFATRPAVAEDFQDEFRLMIIAKDYDKYQIRGEKYGDKDGFIDQYEAEANKNWGAKLDDGWGRLSYLGFSSPSSEGRKVWIQKLDGEEDSGVPCTIYLNHNPGVPRLDWYLNWGLDFKDTINEFQKPEDFYIICEGDTGKILD